jgi:hypothetical protein
MQRFAIAALGLMALPVFVAQPAAQPAAGRWDLTITTAKDHYPSWLEVTEANGQPQVRVQGRVSSVHPVKNLKANGGHLTFTSSEWFGKPTEVSWDVTVAGGQLTGMQKRADGVEGKIAGVPAPPLDRKAPASWTKPEPLFNGKDLSGWTPDDPKVNFWKAIGGDLVNEKAGANLWTTRKFQDFKLHLEYNCPNLGNSGVYLRGRYEVQVEYEAPGTDDEFHSMGAIYGFLKPAMVLPRQPGQWESLDATLVGRRVTIVRNGKPIIDNQEIPGITGGAVDSREAEPGPLYIQGDHTGGMKYRNITISLPGK